MGVQNLIASRSSFIFTTLGTPVYTVPATIDTGNVIETFIVDLLLLNILPTGEDVRAEVTLENPTINYLAKDLVIPGTNQLSDMDIWNNNKKIYSEPVRVSFKLAGLNIGDVINVNADTDESHFIPVLAMQAGIHVTTDL